MWEVLATLFHEGDANTTAWPQRQIGIGDANTKDFDDFSGLRGISGALIKS